MTLRGDFAPEAQIKGSPQTPAIQSHIKQLPETTENWLQSCSKSPKRRICKIVPLYDTLTSLHLAVNKLERLEFASSWEEDIFIIFYQIISVLSFVPFIMIGLLFNHAAMNIYIFIFHLKPCNLSLRILNIRLSGSGSYYTLLRKSLMIQWEWPLSKQFGIHQSRHPFIFWVVIFFSI